MLKHRNSLQKSLCPVVICPDFIDTGMHTNLRALLREVSVIKRELEYRIPRLHFSVNSRRFPNIFEDFCKNKTSFLQAIVENLFLL